MYTFGLSRSDVLYIVLDMLGQRRAARAGGVSLRQSAETADQLRSEWTVAASGRHALGSQKVAGHFDGHM